MAETDQNTTEDEDTDFMIRCKSLDKGGNDSNEAAKAHSPSSTKQIRLCMQSAEIVGISRGMHNELTVGPPMNQPATIAPIE